MRARGKVREGGRAVSASALLVPQESKANALEEGRARMLLNDGIRCGLDGGSSQGEGGEGESSR